MTTELKKISLVEKDPETRKKKYHNGQVRVEIYTSNDQKYSIDSEWLSGRGWKRGQVSNYFSSMDGQTERDTGRQIVYPNGDLAKPCSICEDAFQYKRRFSLHKLWVAGSLYCWPYILSRQVAVESYLLLFRNIKIYMIYLGTRG